MYSCSTPPNWVEKRICTAKATILATRKAAWVVLWAGRAWNFIACDKIALHTPRAFILRKFQYGSEKKISWLGSSTDVVVVVVDAITFSVYLSMNWVSYYCFHHSTESVLGCGNAKAKCRHGVLQSKFGNGINILGGIDISSYHCAFPNVVQMNERGEQKMRVRII